MSDIQNDAEDNIIAGAYMLGQYLSKYGDENLALMCYNCGEAGAKRLWAKGIYSTKYSRSILEYAESLCFAR